MDLPEELDVGIPTGQRNPHLPYRDADQRPDLQYLQSNRGALGLSQLCSLQSQPSQHLQQHVGDRREVQAQLIAVQVVRAGAIAEQHQLFFYAILHIPSGAVVLFIQGLRRPCFSTQRGHYEPRVLSLFQVFGLGHHPSRTAPSLPRLINELFEQPRCASGLLVLRFRLSHLLRDLRLQTFVFRQSQQVLYAVRFTPNHQFLTAESRIPAHHDAHLGPRGTNLCHDALQLLYTSRRRIDVRRSQPCTQQELPAEDVQR